MIVLKILGLLLFFGLGGLVYFIAFYESFKKQMFADYYTCMGAIC